MIGKRQYLIERCASFIIIWLIFVFCAAPAEGALAGGGRELLAVYPTIKAKLEKNQFGAPILLESSETEGVLRVDMYGIIGQPFPAVRDALLTPEGWCDITSLNMNIKACTTSKSAGRRQLTIYSGRKYYQPPVDAFPLKFDFRIAFKQPDYLDAALTADAGPLGTKDHRIRLEAVPLDLHRTLIHFSYSYQHGRIARMAIASYFATIGRDKVGFSIVEGKGGKRFYVDGVPGALERNTVRYYLALETYLETLNSPVNERFEQCIGRWYDLTARYPRQLKELEKSEYLTNKRREHTNQLLLQHQSAQP